ncbi:MAG TPA: radical SAM/SPASM domain-containing protein [Phycisphaerae bacterium]
MPRVLGVVVADLERSAIGTRSRLGEIWREGRTVLVEVVGRLLQVRGIQEIVVLTPREQMDAVIGMIGPEDRVRVVELERRPATIEARVRIGRAWNMLAWRGGAGQWTVFDEEYHPAAIAGAAAGAFEEKGAEHVLAVSSHGVFLDVEMTSALAHHHLHKNHEMRVSYTPAAPGLTGMMLRGDIVKEMGEKNVMPWQLLAYDPKAPAFDTLIREACMQVDPALSKVPNRFCVDTQRSWGICKELSEWKFGSVAEMCLAGARTVAPGVTDLARAAEWPREVELELTGERLTRAPGFCGAGMLSGHSGRADGSESAVAPLSGTRWVNWLERQAVCDDLLVTFGGLGDPLLFDGGLPEIVRAARKAGALSICVQSDLAGGDVEGLFSAIREGLVDVVSVTMYGQTAETYAKVAGADLHGKVIENMGRLAELTRGRGGVPLVIPRVLKVRETIPEMEAFFDFWVERCGWAVIDGPTDRAGSVEFAGVVDMAPPKRKACRRLWDRMMVRADGRAGACDQDAANKLGVGHIEKMTIQEMWSALNILRDRHAGGAWGGIDPCKTCREWHRA